MQKLVKSLLLFILFPHFVCGQQSIADSSISFFIVGPVAQANFTGGDYADRFGFHSGLGLMAGFKHKSNWYAHIGLQYIVGTDVRETDMLDGLAFTHRWLDGNGIQRAVGGWIDNNGDMIYPGFNMGGYFVPLRVGRIFNKLRLGKQNPNCGVFVEVGAQFLQHRVKIEFPTYASMSYTEDAYLKGYDRLTNGLGGVASLGYMYYGNRRFLNFYIAGDFGYHRTANRRSYNYDTGLTDTSIRNDITYGARVGWILPLYNVAPEKFYYY